MGIACCIHIFSISLSFFLSFSFSHCLSISSSLFFVFSSFKIEIDRDEQTIYIAHFVHILLLFLFSLLLLFQSFIMAQAMPDYYSFCPQFVFLSCFKNALINASLYFTYTTRPIFIFHEGVLKEFRSKCALQFFARGFFRIFAIIIIVVVVKITAVFTWPHHK